MSQPFVESVQPVADFGDQDAILRYIVARHGYGNWGLILASFRQYLKFLNSLGELTSPADDLSESVIRSRCNYLRHTCPSGFNILHHSLANEFELRYKAVRDNLPSATAAIDNKCPASDHPAPVASNVVPQSTARSRIDATGRARATPWDRDSDSDDSEEDARGTFLASRSGGTATTTSTAPPTRATRPSTAAPPATTSAARIAAAPGAAAPPPGPGSRTVATVPGSNVSNNDDNNNNLNAWHHNVSISLPPSAAAPGDDDDDDDDAPLRFYTRDGLVEAAAFLASHATPDPFGRADGRGDGDGDDDRDPLVRRTTTITGAGPKTATTATATRSLARVDDVADGLEVEHVGVGVRAVATTTTGRTPAFTTTTTTTAMTATATATATSTKDRMARLALSREHGQTIAASALAAVGVDGAAAESGPTASTNAANAAFVSGAGSSAPAAAGSCGSGGTKEFTIDNIHRMSGDALLASGLLSTDGGLSAARILGKRTLSDVAQGDREGALLLARRLEADVGAAIVG